MRFAQDELADFERSSRLEWIETNGLGGWAASSVSGAHTRRYHGLLVAATQPPVGRMVLLSRLDETVRAGSAVAELGCNRFPGVVHPQGFRHLVGFERDLFPVFDYDAAGVRLRKTVAAIDGENTVVVVYEVLTAPGPIALELRPFLAGRDYHALAQANGYIGHERSFADGVLRVRPYQGTPLLALDVPGSTFVEASDWYHHFEYEIERYRGLDFQEDLWTPGVLRRELAPGERLAVVIAADGTEGRDGLALFECERRRREGLLARVPVQDEVARALTLAADQFIVRRGADLRTLIAGYPWFGDWGRDTMIALPGVCLSTGRHDEARRILRAFALSASEGMLPNRFPDGGETPEYNTVDATLWFFVAARQYLEATGDEGLVRDELLPVLRDIVAWHERGTRYGIRVDADGLLRAGEPGVQLTWMDAKIGDWVVTPRHGKPVEIEALWHNALAILGDLESRFGDPAAAQRLAARAAGVRERFETAFWNEDLGYLADVVGDDGRQDTTLRPNQVFALSLPYPLLDRRRAESILRAIDTHLLTPVGLRSLAPEHPEYRPVYGGDVRSRDGAYHQGTVWSWLLGPWASAVLRFRGEAGRRQVEALFDTGVRAHLREAGVGTVSEILDGDPPHGPRGCFAQAWSVGELLRVYLELKARPAEVPAPALAGARRARR